MRFKLSAFLAVVLLMSFALSGCGQQQGTDGGGQDEEVGAVSVIGVWGGTELEAFNEVADGWEQESGGTMRFEGTRDLSPILRARVQGGNPPDVAILPNPALMSQFKDQLKPLDDMVDQAALSENYSQEWIDQGMVDDQLKGIVIKASPKSTVWYNPKQFSDKGYAVPTSWEELTSLTDKMRTDGEAAPWSMGMEAGGASGWPGSDWIQEIYLAESGPDMYDQWVNHEIPWTDPSVKSAFEKFGQMATTQGNVAGGSQAILAATPEDASYQPYTDPPKANMYFLGAFTQGFISAQFPDLKPVEDYDFFDFPAINQEYANAATVGGDTLVVFNDTPSVRSFVEYMVNGENWQPWVEAGGYLTPSKSVDASSYADPLAQKAALQLTEANPVRFDADDLMPAEVQQAFWKGILDYIQRPNQLDRILQDIETTAADAYQNVEPAPAPEGEGTTDSDAATGTTEDTATQ